MKVNTFDGDAIYRSSRNVIYPYAEINWDFPSFSGNNTSLFIHYCVWFNAAYIRLTIFFYIRMLGAIERIGKTEIPGEHQLQNKFINLFLSPGGIIFIFSFIYFQVPLTHSLNIIYYIPNFFCYVCCLHRERPEEEIV